MRLDTSASTPQEYSRGYLARLFKKIDDQVNNLTDGKVNAVTNSYTAAPTTGKHAVGDIVRNTNTVQTGTAPNNYVILGWICTASGEPGTFTEIRADAAGAISVGGPGASTDNAVMRWDGTGGNLAQNSVVTISDTGAVAGVTTQSMSNQLTSTLATGTAPLVIDSTTKVSNLHVDRATIGDTVTIANEATDTTCFPLFGTAASGNLEPKTNANITFNSSTGVFTSASLVATTADINGGTVDGAVIGGSSAAAGTFTDLTSSGNTILGDGTSDTVTVNGYMGVGSAANSKAYIHSAASRTGLTVDTFGIFLDETYTFSAAVSEAVAVIGHTRIADGSAINLDSGKGATAFSGLVLNSNTAAVTNLIGFRQDLRNLSTGTVTNAVGSRVLTVTNSGGGAITNVFGFLCGAQTVGGTLNAAFAGQIASGTGRWNAYMSGTADNHFAGGVFVGDTANANNALGLTINQGVNDNHIVTCKSSDVATVLTTAAALFGNTETDDFLAIAKASATLGGASIGVFAEDAALGTVTQITSYGGTATTTKSTAGRSLIEVYASEHDGANALANIAADGNVFGVRARVGAADVSVWIVDEDGDTWQNGGAVFNAPIRLKNYTVATLPAGTQGDKAFVTDALGPTYLTTVVGGGAIVTEVFYNGTNWVCT